MEKALLTLDSLSVGYRDGKRNRAVVEHINAALYAGELVALVGRNGAGKSTLLRTMAAYQQPLSGTVGYASVTTGNNVSAQELSKVVSVVLTGGSIANLTVEELVSLGRLPHTGFFGQLKERDKVAVAKAMAEMRVTEFAGRKIASLSDGEKQRCMIAKALAQDTPLLLMDEPTAFLDFHAKLHLYSTMRDIAHKQGKGVVISTHDVELAMRLANKVWLVDNGRLHCGTVEELSGNGALHSFIDAEEYYYNAIENRIEFKREKTNT